MRRRWPIGSWPKSLLRERLIDHHGERRILYVTLIQGAPANRVVPMFVK